MPSRRCGAPHTTWQWLKLNGFMACVMIKQVFLLCRLLPGSGTRLVEPSIHRLRWARSTSSQLARYQQQQHPHGSRCGGSSSCCSVRMRGGLA